MIRRIVLSALFLMGSGSWVLAQEVTIIGIEGKVFVRQDFQSQWEEAQVNKVITQDWEIETKGNSLCVLAFDAKRKNIITVKEYTKIKIESVLPGRVFLPEGRVFALIKNLEESKQFEVRTPTAISGARGTGWLTEVIDGITNVSCFDDVVFVDSLDPSGAVTGQIDLVKGLEVNIEDTAVEANDIKQVSESDIQEWEGFFNSVQNLVEPELGGSRSGPDGQLLPPPGVHGSVMGFPMGIDQMRQEARQHMGDHPEKIAEFERMMQEGHERFGQDFERFLMSGGEENEGFEAFMQEMIQKFGDEFGHNYSTDNRMGTGEIPQEGEPMPPPPPLEGDYQEGEQMPPPVDGESWRGDSGQWDTTYSYDSGTGIYEGFYDAQEERDQTLIDSNLSTCGHYCCPHPECCAIFTNSLDNLYCLTH